VELLRTLLCRTLGLGGDKPEPVLDELSLQGVSRFLQSDRCRDTGNIGNGDGGHRERGGDLEWGRGNEGGTLGMGGQRGISPPALLTPPLPPQQHPEPFFALARELYPGQFKPTVCHYFMRLLQDKGLLLRCYTQNIDTLERVAGLDPELLVEAHGTFYTSHCLRPSCRQRYGLAWMRERIFSSLVPKCEKCQGLVKPGEFWGDSLGIWGAAPPTLHSPPIPHRHRVFWREPPLALLHPPAVVTLGSMCPCRDVAWLGDCDSGCLALAELLGWKEELEELVRREHAAIDAKGEDKDRGAA
ncbi:SIR2 deacetylase, partial [Climacteris rufus]|nr:SIR2 deacetylase [Climacteris rufus]